MTVEIAEPSGTTEPGADAWTTLGQLARALRVPSGELEPTLAAILAAAVRTVPGTDDAGLILVERGQLKLVAATGVVPTRLDELQRDLGTGPCWDAATAQSTAIVTDLHHDGRWPALHEAAAELMIAGMVCVPLWVEERTTGALSLYSRVPGAFDAADLVWTELFATHAALALADAQRAEQLQRALASRDVLGQAKGILMERLRVDADEAFAMLAAASQTTNQKVTAVAEHLVRTGEVLRPGQRAG